MVQLCSHCGAVGYFALKDLWYIIAKWLFEEATTLEMWVALIVTLDVVCLFVCLGHSLQICGTDSKAALADSY